jgi:paraquat-inducible protein B
MPELPPLEELPEAVAVPQRRGSPQLVWIIPILAALIGGWIAVHAILERGPTVTISFLTAEGLEPGKTRVRYKDVDIGEVKSVAIAKDRSHIIVTAQFTREAEDFLVEDTRFWVVRPRISGGQISGFGTLLSGAYIAVDAGDSDQSRRDFVGLEVAPIVIDDVPGRKFMLEAQDLGSLDIGSAVYFRRIKVGEVVAHELDPNGTDVHILLFVHAPYDRFVTAATRFWNASGVDVSLDANGMRVQTQSLSTILAGGVSFGTPPESSQTEEAPSGTAFVLYKDQATAMKMPDGEPQIFVMHFKESLRGLAPGAPVDFRGIVIGEVQSVDVDYEPGRKWFHFPVRVALFPQRLKTHILAGEAPQFAEPDRNELLRAMIQRGFRAQLRTGNLLTGQLYVALDFFPDAPEVKLDWSRKPLELPTVPGTVEELQQSVAKLLKKLDRFPLEEIGANARNTLATLNSAAASMDKLLKTFDGQLTPEAKATLTDLRKTLAGMQKTLDGAQKALASDSPLQQDLRQTLRETARAAQSLRSLADTLDREPESLLRGKSEE